MIEIVLSRNDFEYDITSLVKAFYPLEDIALKPVDSPEIIIKVEYLENQIKISFVKGDVEDVECQNDVNYEDRKETKNQLKRVIYRILSRQTCKKLPWGTLTGIRPVMLPMAFLEQGESYDNTKKLVMDRYYVSDKKAELSINVAKKEISMLEGLDYKSGYSLYIGIPFCPSTCLYCSFTSFAIDKFDSLVEKYLDALEKEIRFVINHMNKMPDTIYIGGGTPTSLSEDRLDRLLTIIDEVCDFDKIYEYTVEAGRPDSITREKLKIMKRHNVGRISINPQTMNQKTLDLIGRKHTVREIIEVFNLARELGFDNINMDIIVGLPDENIDDIRHTLDEIMKLNPDSFTVHSLALKRASRLNINKDEYLTDRVNNSDEIMDATIECAKKMGMEPYYLYRQKNMAGNMENVGYSKPGKECLYNVLIMEEKQDIIAIGAGASTKKVNYEGLKTEHEFNIKDVKGYIERIDEMIERKRTFVERR